MKFHSEKLSGGKTENDLIEWCNSMIPDKKLTGLDDSQLRDGVYLINLLSVIAPDCVNWNEVYTVNPNQA